MLEFGFIWLDRLSLLALSLIFFFCETHHQNASTCLHQQSIRECVRCHHHPCRSKRQQSHGFPQTTQTSGSANQWQRSSHKGVCCKETRCQTYPLPFDRGMRLSRQIGFAPFGRSVRRHQWGSRSVLSTVVFKHAPHLWCEDSLHTVLLCAGVFCCVLCELQHARYGPLMPSQTHM